MCAPHDGLRVCHTYPSESPHFVWLRVFCECVQSLPAHCDVPLAPPPAGHGVRAHVCGAHAAAGGESQRAHRGGAGDLTKLSFAARRRAGRRPHPPRASLESDCAHIYPQVRFDWLVWFGWLLAQVTEIPMQLSYGPLAVYSTAAFFSHVMPVINLGVLRAVFGPVRRHRANYDEWGQYFAALGYRFSFSAAVLDAAAAPGTPFGVAHLLVPVQLDDAEAPPDCNLRIDNGAVSHLSDGSHALLLCHFHHRKGKAPLDRMPNQSVLSSPCIGVRAGSSDFSCHDVLLHDALLNSSNGGVAKNAPGLRLRTMPRQCFVALKENEALLGPRKLFNWSAVNQAPAVREACLERMIRSIR